MILLQGLAQAITCRTRALRDASHIGRAEAKFRKKSSVHYPKSALFLGAGPSQGFLKQPQVGSQGQACTAPRVANPAQPALWRRFTHEGL